MATITNYEIPKEREKTCVTIDMLIIEHIYCATLEEILGDAELMDLILSNGWYKQALCDSCEVNKLEITHRDTKHVLYGRPERLPFTYEQILDQSERGIMGAKIINL